MEYARGKFPSFSFKINKNILRSFGVDTDTKLETAPAVLSKISLGTEFLHYHISMLLHREYTSNHSSHAYVLPLVNENNSDRKHVLNDS